MPTGIYKRKPFTKEHKKNMCHIGMLGKKHSEETKKRMSFAHKDYKFTKQHRKNLSKSRKKWKYTEKTRKILSEAHKGEKSYWWKHGLGHLPYLPEFKRQREKARARDNFQCQDCKIPQEEFERALEVHHKDENKFNNNLDNLITLCIKCHKKIHRRSYVKS